MLKLLCTLLATIFVSTFAQSDSQNAQNSYRYVSTPMNWQNAEQDCESWGGNLVSVQSEEESTFLADFVAGRTSTYWIGYTNTIIDGRWMWTDKSAHEYAFSKWNAGEAPDTNLQQCIYADLETENSWFTAPCTEERNFVCKRLEGPNCSWNFPTLGAPRPEVTTQTSNGVITLTVKLAKYVGASTSYAFTFSDFDVTSRQCGALSNIVNTYDAWTLTDSSDPCFNTYTLRLSISEFIQIAQPGLSTNEESDIISIDTPLYIVYQAEEQDADNSLCVITTYETRVQMRIVLQQESEVEFYFEGGDVLEKILYSQISLQNDRLIIDALLIPTSDKFWLSDISFLNHSRNIPFDLNYESDCDAQNVGCHYRVSLVSLETRDDYSGYLKIGFTFNWPDGEPQQGYVLLKLVYAIVEEPPVLDGIINVVSNLVRSNFMEIIDYFTPFETVRVLSEADPPIEVTDAQLEYTDAWLCCTRDRLVLPPYNPDEGQLGCTQFDDSIMSLWEPLILNGESQESLDVNIVDLGPMIHSKAAFSFEPIGLYGEDKLCYIHTRTRLKVNGEIDTLDSKRDTLVPRGTYVSDTDMAISFKSCSIFQHKDDCLVQESCAWKEELALCWNSAKHVTGAASSVSGSVTTLVLSVVASIGALVLLQ